MSDARTTRLAFLLRNQPAFRNSVSHGIVAAGCFSTAFWTKIIRAFLFGRADISKSVLAFLLAQSGKRVQAALDLGGKAFFLKPAEPTRELPQVIPGGADWQLSRSAKRICGVSTERGRPIFLHWNARSMSSGKNSEA
jgi:hypothetical protein